MRSPSNVALADRKNFAQRDRQLGTACWAPDSRSFIARKQHAPGSESELWHVPVEGGSPRKLDSMLEPNVGKFTLSPDGKTVAFRKEELRSQTEVRDREVWVLENFLSLP
jgi:hypothetical protein